MGQQHRDKETGEGVPEQCYPLPQASVIGQVLEFSFVSHITNRKAPIDHMVICIVYGT